MYMPFFHGPPILLSRSERHRVRSVSSVAITADPSDGKRHCIQCQSVADERTMRPLTPLYSFSLPSSVRRPTPPFLPHSIHHQFLRSSLYSRSISINLRPVGRPIKNSV